MYLNCELEIQESLASVCHLWWSTNTSSKVTKQCFFGFAFVSNVNTVLLLGSTSVNHSCWRTFVNVLNSNQSQWKPSKYLTAYSKIRFSIILTIDVLFPGSWGRGLWCLSFSLCDYQCLQFQCKCLSFENIQ